MDWSAILKVIDTPLKFYALVFVTLSVLLFYLVKMRNNKVAPSLLTVTSSGEKSIAVGVNTGTITIGLSPEKLEKMLDERDRKLTKEIHDTNPKEKERIKQLEAEKKALEQKLANFEETFKEYQIKLIEQSKELENWRGSVSDASLNKAQQALASGDTQAADYLLAEFIEKIKSQRTAEDNKLAQAYYQRGELAALRVDYGGALSHYAEAIRMQADNSIYLRTAGDMARILGQYELAQIWLKQALALFAPDSFTWAGAADSLGSLYSERGEHAKAESLYLQALQVNEKALGKDHPVVATTLNNLGVLYKEEGQYAKAEPLYLRALEIREKVLGPDHPEVASTLSNLATLYRVQGQYTKAEPLYFRALEIKEKKFGVNHPVVAITLANLGILYDNQEQYGKAEPLYFRALEIRKKALGKDHPDVARTLNILAVLYQKQREYTKAESFYLRALEIGEKTWGKNHLDMAGTLSNLATLYQAQEQYTKAEPLYLRALGIQEGALRKDHPDIATTLNNLAMLYQAQRQYAKAEQLYLRAIKIDEAQLGADHPTTQMLRKNYETIKKR